MVESYDQGSRTPKLAVERGDEGQPDLPRRETCSRRRRLGLVMTLMKGRNNPAIRLEISPALRKGVISSCESDAGIRTGNYNLQVPLRLPCVASSRQL